MGLKHDFKFEISVSKSKLVTGFIFSWRPTNLRRTSTYKKPVRNFGSSSALQPSCIQHFVYPDSGFQPSSPHVFNTYLHYLGNILRYTHKYYQNTHVLTCIHVNLKNLNEHRQRCRQGKFLVLHPVLSKDMLLINTQKL